MATARGHHRHEDLRPPGGDRPLRHPAGADPRLLRPEGRHLRQHPRRTRDRREDRQRADPELRLAGGGAGAHRRRQRRQAQREPGRPRRGRAPVQAARHGAARRAVDFDIAAEAAREPDRSRLREVFREYELRDPLRRLEEALGERRAGGAGVRHGRGQADGRAALGHAGATSPVSARQARSCAWSRARARRRRARCSPRVRRGALRSRPTARCWRASARARRRSWQRAASARWSPTTPRRSALVPAGARPRHAAGRLPARAGAARLSVRGAVRGARAGERPRGPARRRRGAARRAGGLAARADRRARPGAA